MIDITHRIFVQAGLILLMVFFLDGFCSPECASGQGPEDTIQGSVSEIQESFALTEKTFNDQKGLPDSHSKVRALMATGLNCHDFIEKIKSSDRTKAFRLTLEIYEEALRAATIINDSALISCCCGSISRLYEMEKLYDNALYYNRLALFEAQKKYLPEILYQWQWQTGRILEAKKDINGAIASYRQAVHTLNIIRQNTSENCGADARISFRDIIGPICSALTDLLLRKSSSIDDEAEKASYLLEARDVIEQFKADELRDYFQDECVVSMKAREVNIDMLSKDTAAVYPVILPDRLELLVHFPDGLKQFTVPVPAGLVNDTAMALRIKLQQPDSRYRRYAQRLYAWLIQPLLKDLDDHHIKNLVIVPDGLLRTIPLSALHDGKNFLIRKYSVAATPGMKLTDPRPLKPETSKILLLGLTESVNDFPSLPSVSFELMKIRDLFDCNLLMDKDYTLANFERELENRSYSIVHIASHGQFGRNPGSAFLLTHDGRLTLDDLERLLDLRKFRKEAVELLTLSACQTAVGDDDTALGLAGISIKAGARSALASLWYVDDHAASLIVTEFYSNMKNPALSKAEALQKAQIKMLDDPEYGHPSYWSSFLLIGNWL